jgi:PLD-like domain/DnaJ domain
METQAYFSGIREAIIQRLDAAKVSVMVAVAWLTDRALFEALVSCNRRGVAVSLAVLDDRINRQSYIAWERLTALGGRLCWIPEGTARAGTLHHKFCLIDNDIVINGSFNWTYRASSADENIVVIQGDADFAEQFQQAFLHLLDKHGHDSGPVVIDKAKLMVRLAVIYKLLELEDFDDVSVQAKKLDHAENLSEIAELILHLNRQDWHAALDLIKALTERGFAITVFQDPLVEEYRWQVRLIEVQVLALEAELADMQRQIHLFDHQQEQTIGNLVRRYLEIKRRYLKHLHKITGDDETHQDAEAAEDTFNQYEEARASQANEPEPVQLDPQQQAELKQLFRKLAMQCHPDRVSDEDKARAKVLFQHVQAAYQQNDLATLQKLKLQIEQGLRFAGDIRTPEQAAQLQQRLAELQKVMAQLTRQLSTASQNATWKILSTQPDWVTWFEQQAGQLRMEIERYQSALEQSTSETTT